MSSHKTNPIGADTCNFPINMPIAQRSIVGALAMAEDKSAGRFFNEVFIEGLTARYPKEAEQIRSIWLERKKFLGSSLFIALVWHSACLATFAGGGDESQIIRAPRRVRTTQGARNRREGESL